MDDFPISLTADLVVIGGASANFTEFLRGLITKIEDYPRLARSWRYVPSFFGVVGVLLFPSAVQVESVLVLLAHGALSPTMYFLAYPYLEKILTLKTKAPLSGVSDLAKPEREGKQ